MIVWISGTQLAAEKKVVFQTIFEAISEGLPAYEYIQGRLKPVAEKDIEKALKDGFAPAALLEKLCFNAQDVESMNIGTQKKGDLSFYALSQSENFKTLIPIIAELAIYCHKKQPAKEPAASDKIFMNYPVLTEHVWKAIWRSLPDRLTRNPGEKDTDVEKRKN